MLWRRSRGRSTVGLVSHATVPTTRRVLVYARTAITTRWLLDVTDVFAHDRRVEIFFTIEDESPSDSVDSAHDLLRSLGVVPVPWPTAVAQEWDLILAASPRGSYGRLAGPLLLTQHGPGFGKPASVLGNNEPPRPRDPGDRLARADVPLTTLTVSHPEQVPLFGTLPATATAVAVGDPLLDQLLVARAMRERFRRELGLEPGQRLVLVSSTWGPRSQFARDPDLWRRLASCLPLDQFRLGMVVHPNVWAAHGRWRVGGWLRQPLEAGVVVLSPGDGWRAGLLAADGLVVDHGSVGVYGTALGVPVLLASFDDSDVMPGSVLGAIGRDAPRLDADLDLRTQIEQLVASAPDPAWALERLTVRPGGALEELRSVVYRLLRLEVGDDLGAVQPRPVRPPGVRLPDAFPFVAVVTVAAAEDGGERAVHVERYPAVAPPPPPPRVNGFLGAAVGCSGVSSRGLRRPGTGHGTADLGRHPHPRAPRPAPRHSVRPPQGASARLPGLHDGD